MPAQEHGAASGPLGDIHGSGPEDLRPVFLVGSQRPVISIPDTRVEAIDEPGSEGDSGEVKKSFVWSLEPSSTFFKFLRSLATPSSTPTTAVVT